MTTPNIVSGAVSTVTELGKDEAWLQGWLKEQPGRLGLGDLDVTDGAADDDDRSFVAVADDRCFSVDVQLGEMEASRGFQVLDNWARNRVRHPDKTHVAVLVTETADGRYRTTLETLAEHLPLVVVELQVWRGEAEAIVIPHVSLASDDVDLSGTAAAKAAEVMDQVEEPVEDEVDATADEAEADSVEDEIEADAVEDETDVDAPTDEAEEVPENKDDTGVADPWGLPQTEAEDGDTETNGSRGHRLLNKVS